MAATKIKVSAMPPAAVVAPTDLVNVVGPNSKRATIAQVLASVPPNTRIVAAGTGMTGGGDLSTDRTIDVVANADGSIIANPNDIQVGVLATDAQHGARGGGTQHTDVVPAGNSGFMTGADKSKLDGLPVSAVPSTRVLTAGAGMAGGGDLSADRTFDVDPAVLAEVAALMTSSLVAGNGLVGGGPIDSNPSVDVVANADGSITVNANDIQVGVLATDAQHGVRGGGTQHTNAIPAGASGFMTGTDKSKLDGLPVSAVPSTRVLTAGAGMTGGGDLSADRTFDVVANADGSIQVNPNDIKVGVLATDAQHGVRGGGTQHADVVSAGASGFMTGADKSKLDGVAAGAHPAVLTWGTLAGVATTTTTRFLDPGYNQTAAGTNSIPYAVPSSGKIRNLRITQAAGVGAGLIVYTLLVNGVATPLSVSIPATAITGSDLVNSVNVNAGDLISFQVTKAVAITTTPTRIVASAELAAS